ncbi:hypothetical protein Ciccas_013903 [Cichlidogyrus casuarinus]|uniref:Uncharacterized protein n=1 Tax=Cichlidogyrus casuarinus TaxID=1844966 RepID=A0ABD2PJY4_9PLAT
MSVKNKLSQVDRLAAWLPACLVSMGAVEPDTNGKGRVCALLVQCSIQRCTAVAFIRGNINGLAK